MFAKVMFLHVSVILSTGGGVPAPVHVGMHTQLPLPPETRGRPPWDQRQTPPRAVYAGSYGQQTGGPHLTGMHSF